MEMEEVVLGLIRGVNVVDNKRYNAYSVIATHDK